MSEHHEISVYLTSPQFLKYKKAVPFQLTNAQLQADNGKYEVDIHLSKKDYKKLLTAIKNGKGYRFSNKNVVGGSLWGSFKKGLSTIGNFVKNNVNKEDVKNVLKQGVDMVAPESVKDIAKRSVDKVVDYGYDDSNKGKSLKEHALSLANDLQPELKDAGLQAGKKIVDKVKEKLQGMNTDDAVEGNGFKKFKKGSQAAKDHMARIRAMRKPKSVGGAIMRPGIQAMNPDDFVAGDGFKFKKGKSKSVGGAIIMKPETSVRDNVPMSIRPVKGSPEMKERMASIRGFRKTKGAGFFDDLSSKLIHVGIPLLGHVAGQALGGVPGAMVGEELGNMGADAIGNLTGRGLRNNIHTPYGRLVDGIPRPVVSNESKERIRKKGYHSKQRSKSGFHILGGSFLQL